MEIVLSKCKLRPWSAKDVYSLANFANNGHIAMYLRDTFPYPYTIKDAEFFISQVASTDNSQIILAIDINGSAVGSIGVHLLSDVYRKSAEIGYWLSEKYWGQGIVTEALGSLVDHVFTKYDIYRIYAAVFETNLASMRVLEKCGFVRESIHRKAVIKNNVIMDEYIYTRIQEE
jgi:RimJ/RimL family protein N-acetyltransferase